MEGIIGVILMICGVIGGLVTFAVIAFKINIYFRIRGFIWRNVCFRRITIRCGRRLKKRNILGGFV